MHFICGINNLQELVSKPFVMSSKSCAETLNTQHVWQ